MAGNTDFGGLVLAKDGKILPASPLPKYKLEFLGDSITAGAYNLGRENEEYPTYMAAESSYLAFGPKLARLLGAEYSVIAASGEGVLHNCGEFGYTSDCHATDNYLRSYYNTPSPAWQETGREPDAIILNHGANDFIDYPTLDKLSGYGNNTGPIYASSPINRQTNIAKCLTEIHGYWIPDDWPVRLYKAN